MKLCKELIWLHAFMFASISTTLNGKKNKINFLPYQRYNRRRSFIHKNIIVLSKFLLDKASQFCYRENKVLKLERLSECMWETRNKTWPLLYSKSLLSLYLLEWTGNVVHLILICTASYACLVIYKKRSAT